MAQTILSATSTLAQQTVADGQAGLPASRKRRQRPFPDRRRSPIAPKIGTVIPASRREALYGRSSYLDVPSEWHRASSADQD